MVGCGLEGLFGGGVLSSVVRLKREIATGAGRKKRVLPLRGRMTTQKRQKRKLKQRRVQASLLDGEFGVVAVAGDDGVLLRFAFFVLHAQGVALVVDEEDLDVAVAAVIFVVRGAVGEDVLVADGVVDCGEDVGQCALEERTEAHAASHGGEGL